MKIRKRILALVLMLLLFCGAVPVAAAPDADQLAAQWGLSKNSVIKMYDFTIPNELVAGQHYSGIMKLRNESNSTITADLQIYAKFYAMSGGECVGEATARIRTNLETITMDPNSTRSVSISIEEDDWGKGIYYYSTKEYIRDYRKLVGEGSEWFIGITKGLNITMQEMQILQSGGYNVTWSEEDGFLYYYGAPTRPFKLIGVTDDFSGLEGWVKKNGKWYYYIKGEKKRSWVRWKGEWYYLRPSDGAMETNGWAQDSVGYCWLDADGKITKNKWIYDKMSGEWFYVKPNGYMAVNQWAKDSTDWYWLGEAGTIEKNVWAKDSKGWCWMGADGKITKNKWIQWNGDWFFLKSNGYMAANEWAKDSKHWYWMKADGRIAKEQWVSSGGKRYYVGYEGYMNTGWDTIDGNMYYFKESGVMAAKEWVKGYWLHADGTWTYPHYAEWKKDAKGWWYGDSSGWYARNNTYVIDDVEYKFDANGYLTK